MKDYYFIKKVRELLSLVNLAKTLTPLRIKKLESEQEKVKREISKHISDGY